MAIDPNPSHAPHKVRPAREHAPAGTANKSRPESGGQDYSPSDVPATPSMNRRPRSGGSTAQPRPDRAPGGAVSD